MSRYSADDDDDFSDEGADWDDSDDDATIPCPYCGDQIHEDAQRCPYCGKFLSDLDAPAARKPLWIALGVIVCLALVLFWSFPQLFFKLFGF